jgi:hypothetical protein
MKFPYIQELCLVIITAIMVLPIWSFRFLPTQDGPSHVANSIILRELCRSSDRYGSYFALRREAIPNLTSHVLLACSLYLFPPAVGEKLLATLYVLAFACGYRYFVGSLAPGNSIVGLAGLLLVYNRSFLLGFYNYCLGIALFWVVLGFCIRRRQRFGARQATLLSALFLLSYFSHLLAFLLCVVGAACVLVAPTCRRRAGILVLAAAAPALVLTTGFLHDRGFFDRDAGSGGDLPALHRLFDAESRDVTARHLAFSNDHLFGPYESDGLPLGLSFLVICNALVVTSFLSPRPDHADNDRTNAGLRLSVAILGAVIAVLYAVLPDHLGEHGSFLWSRLAPLPPLLWLACLRVPSTGRAAILLTGALVLLGLIEAVSVSRYFRSANETLAEYTAAIGRIGRYRTLTAVATLATSPPLVDYLRHAADYYCFDGSNLNINNYEAKTDHFPVKERRSVCPLPGIGDGTRNDPEIVLVWGDASCSQLGFSGGYEEIYRNRRLRVYERTHRSRPGIPRGDAAP